MDMGRYGYWWFSNPRTLVFDVRPLFKKKKVLLNKHWVKSIPTFSKYVWVKLYDQMLFYLLFANCVVQPWHDLAFPLTVEVNAGAASFSGFSRTPESIFDWIYFTHFYWSSSSAYGTFKAPFTQPVQGRILAPLFHLEFWIKHPDVEQGICVVPPQSRNDWS